MIKKSTADEFHRFSFFDQFPVGLHRELLVWNIMESPFGYVVVTFQEGGCPIEFVNSAFEEITGYRANEVLGLSCSFLLDGDVDQEPLIELKEAIKLKKRCTQVVRNYRKDSSLFHNELSVYPLLGESGNITHLLWTQNDITSTVEPNERSLAYRQQTNEALWRLDFNPPVSMNIPETDQVRAVIERGVFGEANDKTAQIYGLNKGREIRGRSLKEYLAGADRENIKMLKKLVRCKFLMDHLIVTEKTANGNKIVTLNNIVPSITEGGLTHLWGAGLDVTELFNAKEKLQKSKDELSAQKRSLEKKNIVLKELIAHIEFEKKDAIDKVVSYISEVALPSLEKIRLNKGKKVYIDLHREALENMMAPHNHTLNKIRTVLSPREMEVCNLVKNGHSNKDIAKLLSITRQTVEKHRRMARKKLGLNNKKVNLYSYLNSL